MRYIYATFPTPALLLSSHGQFYKQPDSPTFTIFVAADVTSEKHTRQPLERINSQFGSDFNRRVLANVVLNANNVRHVVAKVQPGEADSVIVYISDIENAPNIQAIEIPAAYNVTANCPVASLLISKEENLAKDFINHIQSEEGQAILK